MSTMPHINSRHHPLAEHKRAGRWALVLVACLPLFLGLAGMLLAAPAGAQEASAGVFASTPEQQGQGGSAELLDGPACRGGSPAVYCGKVLLAGGGTTSELYDPIAGNWSGCPAGDGACGGPLRPGNLSVNLSRPRAGATLTRLDGPACTGTAVPDYCGRVLLVGGILTECTGLSNCLPGGQGYPTAPEARVELYDPATGRWRSCAFDEAPSASCPAPYPGGKLKDHSATLLSDGRVLIAGGFLNDIDSITRDGREDFYIYDPALGAWSPPGVLYQRRRNHQAVQLVGGVDKCGAHCGKVLIVGGSGSGDGQTQKTGELLDLMTRTSVGTGSDMITPRRDGHSATLLADGRVLVAGGDCLQAECPNPGDRAEYFDPRAEGTKAWVAAAALRRPRYRHTATLLGTGKLLLAGSSDTDPAELYDPATGTSLLTGPAAPRSPATATLLPPGPRSMCAASCGKVLFTEDRSKLGWLYTPNPEVTALSAEGGPATGGTAVTLQGTGLASVTSVRFGDLEATSVTPDADTPDTKLIAISPPQPAGAVGVTATSSGGKSASTPSTVFTYTPADTGAGAGSGDGDGGVGVAPGAITPSVSATPAPGAAVTAPATGQQQQGAIPPTRVSTQQASRARALRACLAGVERHAARERKAARRGSARARTEARRHLTRHRATGRRACIARHTPSPGPVARLSARAISATAVKLSFLAAGSDASRAPAARSYVVKQSLTPIRGAQGFKRAQALCAGVCRFAPGRVGERLELTITDLRPRTTYYYAIAARDERTRRLGPLSHAIRVKTR